MADVTGTYVRGLLIPDDRVSYEGLTESLSAYTQAGAMPGVPESQQESTLTLAARGTMDDGAELRVEATRAGFAGPAGATFKWQYEGDTHWRGWQPPSSIAAFRYVDRQLTNGANNVTALALSSGRVLAFADWTTIATDTVSCWILTSEDTPTWGARVTVYVHGQTLVYGSFPSAIQLPNGRVLVYFWTEDQAATTVQCRCMFSDDEGETWGIAGTNVLPGPIATAVGTFQPNRIRAAISGTQVLMLVGFRSTAAAYYDRMRQYASADLGATFALVAEQSGETGLQNGRKPMVVSMGGGAFLVGSLPSDGTSTLPEVRRLGGAWDSIIGASPISLSASELGGKAWLTYSGGQVTDGDLALTRDDDGVVWAYGRATALNQQGLVAYSTDGGLTWAAPGTGTNGAAVWYAGHDASTYVQSFSAVCQRGRIWLVGTVAANPGTSDPSIVALQLGGYTEFTLGSIAGAGDKPADRNGWETTWLPLDLPENTGGHWTLTVTGGASTPAFNATGDIAPATSAGQTIYWSTASTPAGTVAYGMVAEWEVACSAGELNLELRIGDGTNSYECKALVTPTSVALRDKVAGATIGTVTIDTTAGVQVRLMVAGNDAVLLVRSATLAHAREWTAVSTGALTAGAASSHRVRWGIEESSAATIRFHGYASSTYVGSLAAAIATNTTGLQAELAGRPLVGPPGTYVDDGTVIEAHGGPTMVGDTWHIDADHTYGVRNLHADVEPSPSRVWRSTQTANEEIIAWSWASASNVNWPVGSMLGLWLDGINFRTAYWEGRESGGSWTTLATIDAATDTASLRFTRSHDSIVVDTSTTTNGPYYPPDALVGAHVVAGGLSRRVARNSGGAWTDEATQRAMLRIEGITGGEPASGSMDLVLPRVLCLLPTRGANPYQAYRLRIPGGQATPGGYYEIATCMPGVFHPFGVPYSWGRQFRSEPNDEVSTSRAGIRRVRRNGQARRAVDIAWVDGIDTAPVGGTAPEPDYITGATGGLPVAAPAATPWEVLGVIERIGGAQQPVVYVDGFQVLNATSYIITHPMRLLYGRVMSPAELDSVLGDEWVTSTGEVMRIGQLTIEQEL